MMAFHCMYALLYITNITSAYEDLAYCFWIAAGYKTVVAFPTVVSGAHGCAFIFTHRYYQLLEGCCIQCTGVIDKLLVLFSS